MRKTNTFEIEGYDKKFTVKELTVKEIIGLIQDDVLQIGTDIASLQTLFADRILPLCSNAKLDDLIEMAPSEVQQFWDKLADVNSVFFGLARKTGLQEVLDQLKSAVIADFSRLVVSSLNPDTSTP